MTTWKRWSWRYRVGALFALALLLQGGACPFQGYNSPTFTVPGVGEIFTATYFDSSRRQQAFVLNQIDPDTGRYFRIFPGDPRYALILRYLESLKDPPFVNVPERVGLPGGAGTPPPPPVQ